MSRPALGPADYGYYSSGVKRLRREADQSPLFSAEGRNVLYHYVFKSVRGLMPYYACGQIYPYTWEMNVALRGVAAPRSHGVMVSTLDSESSDPSSNLGGTCNSFFFFTKLQNTSNQETETINCQTERFLFIQRNKNCC